MLIKAFKAVREAWVQITGGGIAASLVGWLFFSPKARTKRASLKKVDAWLEWLEIPWYIRLFRRFSKSRPPKASRAEIREYYSHYEEWRWYNPWSW